MFGDRLLARSELHLLWRIDRRERTTEAYGLVDGRLEVYAVDYDLAGWPAGTPEQATPVLLDCFDNGGWFTGLFDDEGLVAAVVLDGRPIGKGADHLQLRFLHVSRDLRGRGFGQQLFAQAAQEARARGAAGMFVSATPSKHTIDFYLRVGCTLAADPPPQLIEEEPEDIQLVYALHAANSEGRS